MKLLLLDAHLIIKVTKLKFLLLIINSVVEIGLYILCINENETSRPSNSTPSRSGEIVDKTDHKRIV